MESLDTFYIPSCGGTNCTLLPIERLENLMDLFVISAFVFALIVFGSALYYRHQMLDMKRTIALLEKRVQVHVVFFAGGEKLITRLEIDRAGNLYPPQKEEHRRFWRITTEDKIDRTLGAPRWHWADGKKHNAIALCGAVFWRMETN